MSLNFSTSLNIHYMSQDRCVTVDMVCAHETRVAHSCLSIARKPSKVVSILRGKHLPKFQQLGEASIVSVSTGQGLLLKGNYLGSLSVRRKRKCLHELVLDNA